MNRLLIVFALICLASGCRSWSDVFEEREKMKVHVQNAQHAYHAGQYDRAVHQAKKALDIDPDDPKAHALLGYIYLQVVRFAKTRETRLEYCRLTEESFEKAIRSGTERDPVVFKAYFGLGLICFLWSQEVEAMIDEASGRKPQLIVTGSKGESEESIWSESSPPAKEGGEAPRD